MIRGCKGDIGEVLPSPYEVNVSSGEDAIPRVDSGHS